MMFDALKYIFQECKRHAASSSTLVHTNNCFIKLSPFSLIVSSVFPSIKARVQKRPPALHVTL